MENEGLEQTPESGGSPLNDGLAKECLDLFKGKELKLDTIFESTSRVHDWRNYVPEIIEQNWHELTLRERMLVALTADVAAGKEDWG